MKAKAPVLEVHVFILVASFAIVLLLFLPPFISIEWRYLVMAAFSSVCHQIPERSFHIAETSLAVCHRCTGIYAGIPLAMAVLLIAHGWTLSKKVGAFLLLVTLTLMGLDWGLTAIGIWENTVFTRVVSGVLFGLAAGAYLLLVVKPDRKSESIEYPRDNFVL